MVLELHTDRNHAHYLRTLRAILVDAERAKTSDKSRNAERQRIIELPDGTKAIAFTQEGWPAWREISWCSTDKSFVIAIGRDALLARFSGDEKDQRSPWDAHTRAVDDARPEGEVFFNAYLDLAHLRRSFPEAFVRGRTPRMVRALRLNSIEQVMLHGRFVDSVKSLPPMLVMDVTARAQGGDGISHHPVSIDSWDEDSMPVPAPEGSYILAIPMAWGAFAEAALDIHEATINDHELPKFRRARRTWHEANSETFARVLASFEPWLIISDDPPPMIPVPGLGTYVMPLSNERPPETVTQEMDELLGSWREKVTRSRDGVWTLSLHKSGLVRFPSWSIVTSTDRNALVAGWGTAVIDRVREVLSEPKGSGERGEPGGRGSDFGVIFWSLLVKGYRQGVRCVLRVLALIFGWLENAGNAS